MSDSPYPSSCSPRQLEGSSTAVMVLALLALLGLAGAACPAPAAPNTGQATMFQEQWVHGLVFISVVQNN